MSNDMKWERIADRQYACEDNRMLAVLTMSERLIDSEDLAPQIYRYRQHRVRIVDKETQMEDICSHPATNASVDDEIVWASHMIDKYFTEIRP